jgi:Ca2+-binding EF-hand superfamily protein
MMKHFLVAGLLVAFVSAKTYAQQPQQPQQQHDREGFFKKIDTDGDGKLSKAEVDAAAKDDKRITKLKENFDAIDTNKDSFLGKEELQAYRKKQGPRKKEDGTK